MQTTTPTIAFNLMMSLLNKVILLSLLLLIVSCQKEDNEPRPTGSVKDIDGNEYATIQIGNQTWMTENLRTTRYCNGEPIPNVTGEGPWANLTTGAWSYYDNDSQNENPYGKLYNGYAVSNPLNICPCGWHVPTDAEWTELTDHLGGADAAGNKMKSTGNTYWAATNQNATNESGFSALPAGTRNYNGKFNAIREQVFYWSSTNNNSPQYTFYRYMIYNFDQVFRGNSTTEDGMSVRCIKD